MFSNKNTLSSTPGIVPPFKLKPGSQIGNYRILHQLGRGFEAEVYEAIEIPTGIRRALKIYHLGEPETWDRVRAMARFFEKLAPTGAVAQYHHTGTCFLPPTGEPVAFLVMELLSGKTLDKHVRSIKGTRLQRETRCLGLLTKIAEKIARVHEAGFAIGDFMDGTNTIILPTGEPIFCDLEPGERNNPNRDFACDLLELNCIIEVIFPLRNRGDFYKMANEMVEKSMEKPIRRNTMKKLATELKHFLEAFE